MSTDMRVWVGCLGCYNGGDLNGEWVDAADADPVEMGLAQLGPGGGYRGPFCKRCGADEFWVFDHEGMGPFLTGEFSPMEAQQLAEQLDGLDEHELRLLRLYVEALGGRGYWSGPVDWADVATEAQDHYVGEAESLADWAQEFAEETGVLQVTIPGRYGEPRKLTDDDALSTILAAVDWEQVAEVWTQGYSTVRDEERGVIVLFS